MMDKPANSKKAQRTPRAAVALVTVTLAREHEHQGERKPVGAQISVHPETARWLRDQGVISNSPQKD